MNRRDVLGLGLASLSATALTPLVASAQGKYPERPIKLLVGHALRKAYGMRVEGGQSVC